jgi:hypothetical protein
LVASGIPTVTNSPGSVKGESYYRARACVKGPVKYQDISYA